MHADDHRHRGKHEAGDVGAAEDLGVAHRHRVGEAIGGGIGAEAGRRRRRPRGAPTKRSRSAASASGGARLEVAAPQPPQAEHAPASSAPRAASCSVARARRGSAAAAGARAGRRADARSGRRPPGSTSAAGADGRWRRSRPATGCAARPDHSSRGGAVPRASTWTMGMPIAAARSTRSVVPPLPPDGAAIPDGEDDVGILEDDRCRRRHRRPPCRRDGPAGPAPAPAAAISRRYSSRDDCLGEVLLVVGDRKRQGDREREAGSRARAGRRSGRRPRPAPRGAPARRGRGEDLGMAVPGGLAGGAERARARPRCRRRCGRARRRGCGSGGGRSRRP